MLVATHLDVARREDASGSKLKIKVCTHYTNEQGHIVLYQPGLEYQEGVIAHFIELDSWHGEEVRNAKTYDELPIEAKKFLAFIQARIGVPIVFSTTGPERENKVLIPKDGKTDAGFLLPAGVIFDTE